MSGPVSADLVNAALLGTDRRPVEGSLLDAAARARATRLVAGATTRVRTPEPAPTEGRPGPDAAARAVLDELLARPGTDALVDAWLAAAHDAGVAAAPEHWAPLLDRARRSTAIDRRRLAAVLGARGLWFARHQPTWAATVRAATPEEHP